MQFILKKTTNTLQTKYLTKKKCVLNYKLINMLFKIKKTSIWMLSGCQRFIGHGYS